MCCLLGQRFRAAQNICAEAPACSLPRISTSRASANCVRVTTEIGKQKERQRQRESQVGLSINMFMRMHTNTMTQRASERDREKIREIERERERQREREGQRESTLLPASAPILISSTSYKACYSIV